MNHRNTFMVFSRIAFGVLVLAWVLFAAINYITTAESLAAMFGDGTWVIIFSLAVVFSDLGAFSKALVDPDKQKIHFRLDMGKMTWTTVLFFVWLLVTFFDIGLSWVFFAMEMEQHNVVVPQQMVGFVDMMPLFLAFMTWALQFGLVYALTVALGSAMHPAQVQQMPQMQRRPIPTG